MGNPCAGVWWQVVWVASRSRPYRPSGSEGQNQWSRAACRMMPLMWKLDCILATRDPGEDCHVYSSTDELHVLMRDGPCDKHSQLLLGGCCCPGSQVPCRHALRHCRQLYHLASSRERVSAGTSGHTRIVSPHRRRARGWGKGAP